MPTITDTGLVGLIHSSKSASFRAANAHLLVPQSSPSLAGKVAVKQKHGGGKRIRQNSAGLNKTEQAFLDHLKRYHAGRITSQAITLKLGNGVRYTPDFVTFHVEYGSLTAYEVKGYMRDDAAVKLKVAAGLYPWIRFRLVTKRKGGGWDTQEVLA